MSEEDFKDDAHQLSTIEAEKTQGDEEASESTPKAEAEVAALSPRDLINARREAELLEEVGSALEDKAQPDVEDEQHQKIETQPSKVKVKIDGSEEEVSIDDLVKNYQKSESGDRKLQQAALMAKEIEAERARIAQLEDEIRASIESKKQESSVDQPKDTSLDDLKLQRREALEIGDYDEFDRLDEEINKIRVNKSGKTESINADQIARQATEQALNQLQYEAALHNFKNNNSILVNDNTLYTISMNTFNDMCKESSTYSEAFAKTEKVMKEWIGSIAKTESPGDPAMTERQDRKKSIQQEPGRLNIKSAPPVAIKEETASEIIANMRKARGLPI